MKLFALPPMLTDEYMRLMGIFFFIIGIPILTVFVTQMTSQSLIVDTSGILIHGLARETFISWNDLVDVMVTSQYVLIQRGGFPLPYKLQKQIVLKDRYDNSVVINEPQLPSTKKKIISKFKSHAPEKWKSIIKEKLRDW
jgi:hypothetical protein